MFGLTDEVFKEDKDKTTRQKTAPRQNRSNPVCSSNQQAAMTVESVGLPPAGTFNCSRSASVSPSVMLEKSSKTFTETQAHVRRAMVGEGGVRGQGWGGGGHSGCTCERLQDHFQQTVHTDHDNCTDSAQSMQGGGEGGGNRLCRYLPAKKGGGGVL